MFSRWATSPNRSGWVKEVCSSPRGQVSVPCCLPLPHSLPCSRYCPHFQMPNVLIPPSQCVEEGNLDGEGEFSVVEASLQAVQKLQSIPQREAQEPRASTVGPKPSDGFSRLTSKPILERGILSITLLER